jgi:hypothetical protein
MVARKMPDEWKEGPLCPTLKKNETNYNVITIEELTS